LEPTEGELEGFQFFIKATLCRKEAIESPFCEAAVSSTIVRNSVKVQRLPCWELFLFYEAIRWGVVVDGGKSALDQRKRPPRCSFVLLVLYLATNGLRGASNTLVIVMVSSPYDPMGSALRKGLNESWWEMRPDIYDNEFACH
jgi:hypothetical protein